MNTFTEKDEYILEQLRKAGYGWQKYAESVGSQEFITDKQRITLRNMLHKLRSQQASVERYSRRNCEYDDDISDNEAMSFGEYF